MNGWLAVVLYVVPGLSTSGPEAGVPMATTEQALGVFPCLSHDFGQVPHGLKCRLAFPIHNRHRVPIRLAKVQASCGCVAAMSADKQLEPGRRSHLRVVLDTAGYSGEKRDEIYVLVEQPTRHYIVLTVKATVRPDVRVSPGTIDMGKVRRNSDATHTLDVHYTGSLDFRIGTLATGLPYVSASAEEVQRRPGVVRYRITTRLSREAPLGLVRDQLRCTTNHPSMPAFTLAVSARVETAFQVDPATLFFGFVRRGKTLRRTVHVHGDRPFRITRFTSTTGRVKVDLPTVAKKEHALAVHLDPSDKPGNLRDQVTLHLDLPEHPRMQFTVYAHVRAR